MKYAETTGRTIAEDFERFDWDNPEVYQLFCRFTFDLIEAGHKKVGAKMIAERIRWEGFMTKKPKSQGYKINNVYIAHYARKFMRKFPQHKDKFETRKLHSQEAVQRKIEMK